MTLEEAQKAWYEENAPLGKELGYPECCIKEFCDQPPMSFKGRKPQESDLTRYKAAHINGEFTGFIPCLFHAKQVIAREITLNDLIKDRSIKFLPFPYQFKH